MKKIVCLLIALCIILSFTACSGRKEADRTTANGTETSDTEIKAEETTAASESAEKDDNELTLTIYQFPETDEYKNLTVAGKIEASEGGDTPVRFICNKDATITLYSVEYDYVYDYAHKITELGSAEVKAGECREFDADIPEVIPSVSLEAKTADGEICRWLVSMYGKDTCAFDVTMTAKELTEDTPIIKLGAVFAETYYQEQKNLNRVDSIFWNLIAHGIITIESDYIASTYEDDYRVPEWKIFEYERTLFNERNGEPPMTENDLLYYHPDTAERYSLNIYSQYSCGASFISSSKTDDGRTQVNYLINNSPEGVSVYLEEAPGSLFGWTITGAD